jgi:signal transduction histidine kinase
MADVAVAQRRTEGDLRRLRHDVRQSLGAVMTLASIIDMRPLDDPSVHGCLQQMRGEVERMATLCGGADPGTAAPVEVGSVASDVWQAVAETQSCSMVLRRSAALWVQAEPLGLARSLRNLLENAVRAAGRRGQVELRLDGSADSVTIEVADDGPGFGRMPAQQRLGLLTVGLFAEEHDGVLLVGGSDLGGASVRLTLPRLAATAASSLRGGAA